MSSRRLEKVKESIKAEICQLLLSEVRDPRIGFVTVTDVEISSDLRHAKVFISVFGDEKSRQQSIEGLNSAAKFIRLLLGRNIRLRYTPEIAFELDSSLERGARIFGLLAETEKKEK